MVLFGVLFDALIVVLFCALLVGSVTVYVLCCVCALLRLFIFVCLLRPCLFSCVSGCCSVSGLPFLLCSLCFCTPVS